MMLRPIVTLLVFNLSFLFAQSNIADTRINTTIPSKGPRSQDSWNVSTARSSSDTAATDTGLASHVDATNPSTLISSSQGQTITSNGSLNTNIRDSKSTPSFTSHALSSLPSNGMVASSGFLTYGYRSLQGVSSRTNGSFITGVTAASRPVTPTGFSNHLINQTSPSYANGTYYNQSGLFTAPGDGAVAIAMALQPERAMVPVKQPAASSTGTAQLSQLDQSLAPAPSPAPAGTADSGPHPVTGQQQDNPNTQAASLPESDNRGSAASTYVLPGSSTYFLPQITTQPAPVVAGKPVVDAGGGNFQVNGQTLSRGGATANIEGISVYVNPQGAPVVGTQTYPPGPTAATSTIGEAPLPSILNLAGGQSLTQVPNNPNAYVVSGTTLLPGLPAAIISGTSYSLAPSGALILGTSTIPLATAGSNAATGILTAGSEVFTPLGSTAVAVNGATLSLNGPGTTDHSTIFSLGPGGLVVGSSTYAFATPAAPAPASNAAAPTQQFPVTTILSAAGQTFTANPLGFSIAGTTLAPGSPGIKFAGTRISLGASGILDIGSSTVNLSPTALTVADQTFTPNPTAFSIAGTTLTAGGPGITISGTLISLGTSGLLDIGGSTIKLSSPTAYTIAGKTFTPNPTAFSIDGTTITAGGLGVTISGTPILLRPGRELVMGSSTIPLSVYAIAGQTFTPNPTAFSIDSTTITAGGPGVTISGTPILLRPGGELVIGSSTIPLSVYTVANETFTPNPTAFSIDSTTITAGGPGVTISGTPIHLQPGGELVIGSSTIPLSVYTIAGQTFTPNPSAFSIDGTTITAGGPGLNINGTSILLLQGGDLVIGNTTFSLPASNLASTTSTPNITASSIDAGSSSNIAPGGGSTSVIVGGAGATRTGGKVRGGAVGMRCRRFWWEGLGFVGFWLMMMMVVV